MTTEYGLSILSVQVKMGKETRECLCANKSGKAKHVSPGLVFLRTSKLPAVLRIHFWYAKALHRSQSEAKHSL